MHNHICRGTEIRIAHSERVFVALGIQHAIRMRCIIFLSVACPTVPYFSTLFRIRHDFLSIYNSCRRLLDTKRHSSLFLHIIDIIEKKRLQSYGHVKRMPEERLPKLIMEWIPLERRKRGCPRKTWMEGVQAAMTIRNLETT